jgi:hypothetical protein
MKSPAPLRAPGWWKVGLLVRRSQRRSDRFRHVRRSRTYEAVVESGALVVLAWTARAPWMLVVHAVVMAFVMSQVGDLEAGEEDAQDDEHDAGDDHHPGGESVEPIGLDGHGCRVRGDCGRRCWGVRCFGHTRNDAVATARSRWVQLMKHL